jgi:hypothetical protein
LRRFTIALYFAETCGSKKPGVAVWGLLCFFGNKFSTLAEPGFFVPALQVGFYPAGKCGAKKGGVNELGKLRSVAKRNGVILTF